MKSFVHFNQRHTDDFINRFCRDGKYDSAEPEATLMPRPILNDSFNNLFGLARSASIRFHTSVRDRKMSSIAAKSIAFCRAIVDKEWFLEHRTGGPVLQSLFADNRIH
jgi:hypothetical protein